MYTFVFSLYKDDLGLYALGTHIKLIYQQIKKYLASTSFSLDNY